MEHFIVESGYGWSNMAIGTWTRCMKRAAIDLGKFKKKNSFDAIACVGSSGMMAGSILGMALQIPVIYVRKKGEKSHGNYVESNSKKSISTYIIVDDLISTGSSINWVVNTIDEYAKEYNYRRPECVGIYLYDDHRKGRLRCGSRRVEVPYI